MSYSPSGYYLWDFWLIHESPVYHLFHLQAPRSLPDPELRHNAATIAHAVSTDLCHWTDKGEVISPGRAGDWDDLSVWTGSVIKSEGLYHMLYTGRCHAEQGTVQRIGLARSEDLSHWEKYPGNPVMEADPKRYEKFGSCGYYWESWRDPYLFYDPVGHCHYAFITARTNHGELDERGCVATAKSTDLFHWKILPPLFSPGKFTEMEVPQILGYGGRNYLLFSTNPFWYASSYLKQTDLVSWEGDHYAVADALFGEYRMIGDGVLSRANEHAYASKIVIDPAGAPVLLSWLSRLSGSDEFAGALSNPRPVSVGSDCVPDIKIHPFIQAG
jgi:beta-fructofuranosidase